ncbi:MAG: magnesium-translocating P-type ATPase [Isosphaeraceae bacterium]|nr:magnesium-translocating P-type ATPase [Isosphaeraceae bacterium]
MAGSIRPRDERDPPEYWSVPADALMGALGATPRGLASREAQRRLAGQSPRLRRARQATQVLRLLLSQFASPIILTLLAAAALSFSLGDATNALIILAIVLVSGLLGFRQEWGATDAVAKLLALVQVRATVLRDDRPVEVPIEQVVPGDVVILNAGDLIPGDGPLLEARDLFVNEASLTGETFPVEKGVGTVPPAAPLARRTNCLFLGTSVISGTARLLVVRSGRQTEFGRVSEALRLRPPETEFERGIRRFGALLLEITLLLVLAIFAINVSLHRPVLESLLFALAIAVGLTPQLLPAIISVNLAHGARRMAQARVIVRRLAAIEDLGGMDILCADKTGTLTEGKVRLHAAVDADGRPSEKARLYAHLNAAFQAGYTNPIDQAIVAERLDITGFTKLDEEPYDFVRKRLSVLVAGEGAHRIITKGALASVLEVCSAAEMAAGERVELSVVLPQIERRFGEFSAQGFRVLGIAYRDVGAETGIDKGHETGLTFLGLLAFDDPLRAGIVETLRQLHDLGVALKLITGDSSRVAAHVARQAGLPADRLLTGLDLRRMSDEALVRRAVEVAVFAEVEPNQKERIVLALKKAGHDVGFLGDGINDAPALHAADVGISVADAVDVAREAAQIVLLEKDLAVLVAGVREGRRAFANTLKYVFMATSANFGNMFSLAGASLFLSFLPLLPKQVLLTNLLTDLPEMTIAGDRVDPEMVDQPRRWDVGFLRRFVIVFGVLSSAFDYLTFGLLLWLLGGTPAVFRTGWFVESVISASSIVLVIRTRRRFFRSRPGRSLLLATLLVIGFTVALPYTPLAPPLGLTPLPLPFFLALGSVVLLYVAAAEVAKGFFYEEKGAIPPRQRLRPGHDATPPLRSQDR